MQIQPVILLIFDGWGIRKDPHGNAILEAQPNTYFGLLNQYPNIAIEASGEAVGLPNGQMGNSEVGHTNMGAGRVVYQDLTRIDKAIRDESFFKNPVLLGAVEHAKKHGSTLHLMGLVSDGGVHSSLEHLIALLDLAKDNGLQKVRVHAFLDGRDVPPKSAGAYLHVVEEELLELDLPQIATVSGRYYAMDRDKRWERVEKAYDCLVSGEGGRQMFSEDALLSAYNNNETDEFVLPTVCDVTYTGMEDNDAVIFFNFRPDRARELTQAMTDPDFDGFQRKRFIPNLHVVCMSMYDEKFTLPIAYPKQPMTRLLAEVLSENGVKQFRTAETEKYAHVTYFFNGGFEAPYPGEDRKMIPSPKVATYDLQPEMSLDAVTNEVVGAINSGNYQSIVVNFANPDMVGHTGVMPAAIDAVKAVDQNLKRVVDAALQHNWVLLITADHGNIECMVDEKGGPHTAHTTDPVPLILVSNDKSLDLAKNQAFTLSSIAPTILDLMHLPIPPEMTSPSMLVRQESVSPVS